MEGCTLGLLPGDSPACERLDLHHSAWSAGGKADLHGEVEMTVRQSRKAGGKKAGAGKASSNAANAGRAQVPKKEVPREKPKSRPPNYESGMRIAQLVDEFPRNTIGRRLSEVCKELGVGPLAIRRYVKALGEVFITEDNKPQFIIEPRGGEVWLVRRPERENMSGSLLYHLVSVYFSLEFFKLLENNVMAPTLEAVMTQLETSLPESLKAHLPELPRKFFAAPSPHKDYSGSADQLEDAITAIIYQYEAEITYKKVGEEPKTIEIKPLTLLYHRGGLYLVALSWDYERPYYYNVERIQEFKLLKDRGRFTYPKDYHPKQMIQGAFGVFGDQDNLKTFRLRFPPDLADYIMSFSVHESQQFDRQEDGAVILTLTVTDSEEVRAWIRSFGNAISVVEEK